MALPLPISSLASVACDCRTSCVRRGLYFRKSDRRWVQRYLCSKCGRTFSEATYDPCFGQKKRQFNFLIFRLLGGGYSLRRTAVDLNLNRKTVVRKFIFLGLQAKAYLRQANQAAPKVVHMQFDDVETFEHSKLKPLSITLAVTKTRRILGVEVSEMPAKGKLAKLSRKKYGRRKDERPFARQRLFSELEPLLDPSALVQSDQNPHYPADVKKYLPGRMHKTFKGRRGCVVGQGELKRGGYDPLFSLNHTCAMLRANINRLFRKTWCTTKKKERLQLHLALYACNHNFRLLKKGTSAPSLPLIA